MGWGNFEVDDLDEAHHLLDEERRLLDEVPALLDEEHRILILATIPPTPNTKKPPQATRSGW
ncbi:MAG: hypothetical protein ACRC5C_04245, partial [Bacilli bacterium]